MRMEGIRVVEVTEILNYDLLPVFLQNFETRTLSMKKLNDWIEKRLISKNRVGIKDALRNFGKFNKHRCMFSLSDQYWFQHNKEETWDKLNFFTNPYNEDVGKIFFSPWEVDPQNLTSHSPDLTTNGILRKRWTRGENGESYLLKAGCKEKHQEPLSEVLASITLKRLNIIPFVKYELTVDGMMLCSKCKNFVDKDSEFVPASQIYYKRERDKEKHDVRQHLVIMCEEHGIEGAQEYIETMIAADRIIGNDDRHMSNFGFIRSAETGAFTGFAPLFDSGSSYWGNASVEAKSRLFNEKAEHEALMAVMKKTNINIEQTHREMFALIDKYPEISKKKKEEVKERINNSEKEMETIINAMKNKTRKTAIER